MLCWLCETSKRYTHLKVHCSTIYNSQDMEATQVFIDREMDREDMVYIYIYPLIFQWTFRLFLCVCALSCFRHVQLFQPYGSQPTGSSVHGILQARILGNVLPCHPSGDLPNPMMETASLSLLHQQAGSLSSVPLEKPLDCFCILANLRHFQM